jgi:hypothetical protein
MTKKTKATKLSNERIFFEHIGAKITILAKAYQFAANEIDLLTEQKKSVADIEEYEDNIDYKLIITQLSRAINIFKNEMKLCLEDYYYILDKYDIVSENAPRYIKSQLEVLYFEYKRINKNIPENILKKGLGSNYKFHKNVKKLTVKTIMNYFETNYILHIEK